MSTSSRFARFLILGIFSLIFFVAMICVAHAQAQQGFAPLQKLDDSSKLSGLYQSRDLSTYINNMFFFFIALGGMLAVGRLAYAGWLYMIGENYGYLKKAKEIVGNVTVGLLLLLSIWLILKLINPQILNLDILKTLNSS